MLESKWKNYLRNIKSVSKSTSKYEFFKIGGITKNALPIYNRYFISMHFNSQCNFHKKETVKDSEKPSEKLRKEKS